MPSAEYLKPTSESSYRFDIKSGGVSMGAQISVLDCDACKLARYLRMFQVGAVASAGLHISLHLGEGSNEPKSAIAAPALPVATNRLSGIPFARGCGSD
jgi:hypothetical protein